MNYGTFVPIGGTFTPGNLEPIAPRSITDAEHSLIRNVVFLEIVTPVRRSDMELLLPA